MTLNKKTGVSQNWVKTDSPLERKSAAKKKLAQAKQQEIGKKYIRIPHPTLKGTFILKEKLED